MEEDVDDEDEEEDEDEEDDEVEEEEEEQLTTVGEDCAEVKSNVDETDSSLLTSFRELASELLAESLSGVMITEELDELSLETLQSLEGYVTSMTG